MAEIHNFDRLISKLLERQRRSIRTVVSVGYTAASAIYVHENKEAKLRGQPRPSGLGVYWGPSMDGPGFLLGPAREFKAEITSIIVTAIKAGKTIAQALLLGGLRLQRESQKRVPVEYGALRASAFTRMERA